MVVDSSALLCVFFNEPEMSVFAGAMERAAILRMGAPTFVESSIVAICRRGPAVLPKLELFMETAGIRIVPFTSSAGRVAAQAYVRFGKGRHPAGLNFGDCISYAVAKTEAMPLLFKGNDFRLTDVAVAV